MAIKIKEKYEVVDAKKLISEIENKAGKFYDYELVIVEDVKDKKFIKGFEAGKKYMKEEITSKTNELKFEPEIF